MDATAVWWRPAHERPSALTGAREPATSESNVAFAALVAFTVILLLSPQVWFPALKVLRIALLAATVAMVAHVIERTIHRKSITPVSPELGLALALVCWSVLTIPLSYWPGGGVRTLLDHYLKAIVFFWLLGAIVNSTVRLHVLGWTLVLCSVPLAATAINNYVAGEVLSTGVQGFYRITGYMGGLTTNPNDLALMLNLIVPIAGALAWSSRGVRRWAALAAMALSVAAVILTFSRAGFLTLAAIFIMFVAVLVRRRAPGAAVLLLMLALVAPPLLPDGYVERLSTIANIEADETGSAQGRWTDVKVAMDIMADNPVIGVGIGQDMIALNQERGRDTWRSVHNAYLQYGVDLGVPGLLLFVWLNVLCFRTARGIERRAQKEPALQRLVHFAAGVQISLVAFAVAAMFHPIAYQFYFFSVAGLAVGLRNAYQAERTTPEARLVASTSAVPDPASHVPDLESGRFV